MEITMKESLLKSKDPNEMLYKNQIAYEYDYEINSFNESKNDFFRLSESGINSNYNVEISNDSDKNNNKYNNPSNNSYNNKITLPFPDSLTNPSHKCSPIPCCKRNYIKSLISRNNTRLINPQFDLDLTYITKRVIAMAYPAKNCEAIYRNSIKDVKHLFKIYHNDKIKIYNLCIDQGRIYDKSNFPLHKVALFPFEDHSACPIKFLLAFCVDICLYLVSDKDNLSTAAVHCKAGKGRTWLMI